MYVNSCPPDVTACLMATAQHSIDKDGILATRLCTHKEDVEDINNDHLRKLTSMSNFYIFRLKPCLSSSAS